MNPIESNTSYISFFHQQLEQWPAVKQRFSDLHSQCKTKELPIEHSRLLAQFNPARVQSAKAKTDTLSIQKRPCFLCSGNRPHEQMDQKIGRDYQLLVNPYPILPVHFTIAAETHRPQGILLEFTFFQELLNQLAGFLVFYNGPRCGASAPDHQHFQAGSKGYVPIEKYWETDFEPFLEYIHLKDEDKGTQEKSPRYGIFLLPKFPTPVFVIRTHKYIDASPLFHTLYHALPSDKSKSEEPMLNVLGWQKENDEQIILVFPRSKHRPEVYFRNDEEQMSISPGAIDMGGLLITINQEDFNRITPQTARDILSEVGISREEAQEIIKNINGRKPQLPESEPEIQVGILSCEEVSFTLNENYLFEDQTLCGEQTVTCKEGELLWNGKTYSRIDLNPEGEGCFTLPEVMIGIQFHWQKKEKQTFKGGITLLPHDGQVVLINRVKTETYLSSVICSEMNSASPFEFLKASAIISRSWILSQKLHKKQTETSDGVCGYTTHKEIIRWYEQSEHQLFDVCADDHCQRYQGIRRITSNNSLKAVTETRGEVLIFDNDICDARFSKCCGGVSEEYRYCWDDQRIPYLTSHQDCIPAIAGSLRDEAEAKAWIESSPECFCNTKDRDLLHRILNQYDRRTKDFFRWQVVIPQKVLARRIKKETGIDFGKIIDLVPVERGPGGHLSKIKIVGSHCTKFIGKELEIRRILSQTHLYSSAFIVEKGEEENGVPQSFTLRGAGWGHGVGMCQIGAAVMGKKGYDYKEILKHYYPNTTIKKLY